ncbi:protein-export chaperone SecB [Silanimonas lenta]|uniref:protein-export chaperone SecB n=1 Tax=Silanimonas lenta TaxID=265429 RepID=UPI0004145FF4|nr:protein-export chaperone SecB [Silanimonas lenta]
MSDETNTSAAGADIAAQAQFTIQKIYVKDLSFEAPGAPMVFNEQGNPDLNLNLGQKVGKLADDIYEVVLSINLTCKLGDKTVYIVELEQAGIFGLAGFDERNLDFMLGTYCPNVLFPYARQLVSDLIQAGGFPPFFLQPINFEAIYAESLRRRAEQLKAGSVAAPAAGNA